MVATSSGRNRMELFFAECGATSKGAIADEVHAHVCFSLLSLFLWRFGPGRALLGCPSLTRPYFQPADRY